MKIHREVIKVSDPAFPIRASKQCSNEVDLSSAPHLHKEIEVVFIPKGNMIFFINGEKVILSQGSILFINCLTVHSSAVADSLTPTELCLLQFDPSLILHTELFYEYKYLTPFINHSSQSYQLVNINEREDFKALSILIEDILNEIEVKSIAYEISIKSYLYKIITLLYRNSIMSFDTVKEIQNNKELFLKLDKAFKLVENNYYEYITVEQVCKSLSFNYHYFCRLFKAATGKSFIQYLNFVRTNVAEKLLLTTDKSITEIIAQTGFSSMSYFNRVFKKHKGVSPSVYRNKFKGK